MRLETNARAAEEVERGAIDLIERARWIVDKLLFRPGSHSFATSERVADPASRQTGLADVFLPVAEGGAAATEPRRDLGGRVIKRTHSEDRHCTVVIACSDTSNVHREIGPHLRVLGDVIVRRHVIDA